LFLSDVLWEEEQWTAKAVDGYSTIVGAQTHSSKLLPLTYLFPMWCWSCRFCGLDLKCILHMAIALAAVMMKTFLHKSLGNYSCSLKSKVDPNATPSWAKLY
jgi:hypothetical protein